MSNRTKYSSQNIDNMGFDETYLEPTVLGVKTDGQNLIREITRQVATKVTASDANTTFVAIAPVGSSQSNAVWQVKKILVTGNDTVITWAGGGSFNQIATDLTSLTYA